jgi:ubiquilin
MNTRQDPLVKHFEGMGLDNQAAEQQAQRMREMMESPQMQALLSDPNTIRTMLEADPAMRRMMQESPELREVLNNPEELQRVARIMSNPNLSREFLRGIDLQINQAEAAGFGAQLSSASAQVNRFMEQAADDAAEEASRRRAEQANNPFASLFGGAAAAGAGGNANAASEGAALPWGAPPAGGAPAGAGGLGGFGGLGGLGGLGDLGGMGGLGGMQPGMMPSREARQAMMQMMQNPAMRETYRAMMPSMIASQPELRSRLAMMGMSDIETNPASMDRFLDIMTSPESFEMMNAIEDAMAAGGGAGGAAGLGGLGALAGLGGLGGAPGGGAAAPGGGGDMMEQIANLQRLMGGAGGGGAALGGAPGLGGAGLGLGLPPPPSDPETEYASQLQQLNDMGFWDRESNVRVLVATRGNVNAAVERLLSAPP